MPFFSPLRAIRRSLPAVLLGLALAVPAAPALAVQPDERLDDPALEARARDLSAELRCLVCQNENIDNSNAPLARDLRLLVRDRLTAGDSDAEVLDFIVARYGDYVLMRPPFQANTLALWLGPAAIFAVAVVGVGLYLARRGRPDAVAAATAVPLSAEERAALDRLLAESDGADGAGDDPNGRGRRS